MTATVASAEETDATGTTAVATAEQQVEPSTSESPAPAEQPETKPETKTDEPAPKPAEQQAEPAQKEGEQAPETGTPAPAEDPDKSDVDSPAAEQPNAGNEAAGDPAPAAEDPQPVGSYSGQIFGDDNDNEVFDDGEALSGVTVTVTRKDAEQPPKSATTGADGRFSFADLEAGDYSVKYTNPPHYIVLHLDQNGDNAENITISANGNVTKTIRAVREGQRGNLVDVLSGAIALDKDSYTTGDTAHWTLKLTNTGTRDLDGVVAICGISNDTTWIDTLGDPNGANLAPKETRSWDREFKINDEMAADSAVGLACFVIAKDYDEDEEKDALRLVTSANVTPPVAPVPNPEPQGGIVPAVNPVAQGSITPATTTAQSQDLAYTGASVGGLFGFGLAALVAGGAAVLFTRRRRTN
ncbi:SdrD B-like domain-containing protein [Actinokineospora enzanensis]|uniref:SdrD B-like domain-containing protein n=1 Tax=Actinokineospora enzanensis TaxID=155975 RepID=UPI0012EBD4AD|nr:SdrD B-like domain-containing protein [Actinokineospora enzanensis]